MTATLQVLLIEDDPDVRLGCEQALKLEDIPVSAVESAQKASGGCWVWQRSAQSTSCP